MRTVFRNLALALLIGVQMWGCETDPSGVKFQNQAPNVWLSAAPPEGSVSRYTIHLFWGGWDPDGEIAYYEYLISDNEGAFLPSDTVGVDWNPVVGNDSVFVFSADQIPDSAAVGFTGAHEPEEFQRSHTFFIRAVDEEGLRSKRPAYRSFTARTLSPTVEVVVPAATGLNAADVPPITTFQWLGRDYVSNELEIQEPDSVRWIIVPTAKFGGQGRWGPTLEYIRNNPDAEEWSDWHWYQAPQDSGKFWSSPPLDFGDYYFAVQVMDEAGAISPVFDLDRNLRRVKVGPRSTGPILTVTNRFVGTIRSSSPTTPPVVLDLPANVPMEFEFQADASSYGGLVSGYRYGWDILDLNDDEQWEIDFTPFIGVRARSPRRTFFFGTHSFFIEVVDNSGFKSRVEVRVNIIPFTMENNLLYVDDWLEGDRAGWNMLPRGATPSDLEHDLFWEEILESVDGFNPARDMFEIGTGGRNELPIQILASYRTLIWNATGSVNSVGGGHLNDLIKFIDPNRPSTGGRSSPNLVSLFLAAGGHVLLCGNQIMTMSINRTAFGQGSIVYPIIFRYELAGDQDGSYPNQDVGERGVGDNSFPYNECCLNVLDQSYIANLGQIRRSGVNNQRCPVNLGLREQNGQNDGMRSALPLDETTGGGFPQLDLRFEAGGEDDNGLSDPLRFYHESKTGLTTDIYNPPYFTLQSPCSTVTENNPPRSCFQPIYGNGCLSTSSSIYNAPVAFWTTQFATRVPDVGGPAGRSAIWGFHPVYFKPAQVKKAMEIILHDEWKLPRI